MDYIKKSNSDAWTTALEFVDEMVEQYRESGEISNDLLNDYPGGDSYHHENHVDAAYDLKEAAEILDQLSDYEETDDGLWQGLDPRNTISAQAAYTYGNAVYDKWREIVEDLNDTLSNFEFEETEDQNAYHRAFIKILVYLENYKDSDSSAKSLFEGAIRDLRNLDFSATLVLSDWLEENQKENQAKKFRQLIEATKKHQDDE